MEDLIHSNIEKTLNPLYFTLVVCMTEQQVKEKGIDYKVGRFPFTASGKGRGAVPVAVANDLNLFWTYVICILGNMLPVPIILPLQERF